MKILFVVADMYMGGVTTSVINFCNDLIKRKHEVVLLNMGENTEFNDKLDKKVKIVNFTGRSRFWNLKAEDVKGINSIKKIPLYLIGLFKKVTIKSGFWYRIIFAKNSEKFDYAIAFRQCAPCYSYVLNKVKAKGKIGFVHGDVNYMNNAEKTFLKYMPKFDKIAYVSNAVKEGFINKYAFLEKNACTVYNMFNKEQILKMAKEKNPFNFDLSVKNIVTVSRIENSQKQVDWIPQICAKLKDLNLPPFHWYVVGGGEDFDYDKSLIEKYKVADVLTFTGNQMNPFVIENDATFTVLPTRCEAYPMTVIESLILKKPIVSSEYAAVRETIIDGKNGLIAKQSVDDLVEKIKRMLLDEDGVYTNCRKYLESFEYSTDFAYDQILKAFGEKINV